MFDHLIGNQNVKESLAHLLRGGRLPNSFLFAGPDGVGKKQFAFELAKALVCTGEDGRPCGRCSACLRVEPFEAPPPEKKDDFKKVFFDRHADVGLVVPFNRTLLVDAIRSLEKEAHFQPYESRSRVFIINDAEKMNDEAANALLKTLEEPPSTTFLILITSRPDALLSTVRSRCQTIRFAPVAEVEIERLLVEQREFSHADAELAARVSRGSVGAAMAIDVGDYLSRRTVQMSVLEKAFVNPDRSALLRVAEQMNDAKNKEFYEENLAILEALVRDLWLLRNGAADVSIANVDISADLRQMAGQIEAKKLECALAEIESLRRSFAVNTNRKSATDALFMKISA